MCQSHRRRCTTVLLIALAATAALLFPGGARADEPAGQRYALLIAVREYDKNQLRDLPYAEDDVTALAEVLRKAGYKRVVLMTQSEGAKQARYLPMAANIRKTLKGMLEDRTPDDRVLVAFAGHGVQFQGEDESYFCPMDAKLENKETLISLGDVYKDLEHSEAGVRLLVVDACRNDPRSDESRAVSRVKLESVTRPQKALPPGGVAALFSCSAGERAFESSSLKHGVFFHFLVEGLQGKADLDGDGQVDLDELVRYTKRQVADFVKEQYGDEVRQMPELIGKTRGLLSLAKVDGGGKPDATTDEKPKEPAASTKLKVGRRIFGRWAADGFWYSGTIKQVKEDKYLVHWEDDTENWLDEGEVTIYQPLVGDRVEGDWLGKGYYYKGRVTSRRGEKVHILYDDGDQEDTTISRLRAEYDGIVLP